MRGYMNYNIARCAIFSKAWLVTILVICFSSLRLAAQDEAVIYRMIDQFEHSRGDARFQAGKNLIKAIEKEEYIDEHYAQEPQKSNIEATAYYALSEFYYDHEDFEKAKKSGLKALALCDNSNLQLESDINSTLSCIEHHQGNFMKAVQYLQKCYEIDVKLNDKERISSDLNNLAATYLANKDPEGGKEYILNAIAIERKLNRKDLLANRLGIASEIFLMCHELDTALSFAQEAYELDRRGKREGKAAVRQSQLAGIYIEQGKYAEAHKHLQQAIPVLEKNGNKHSLSICYTQMGDIQLHNKNNTAAAKYYSKSLVLTNQLSNRYLELRNEKGLWQALRETDPAAALKHLEVCFTLSDTLFREESAREMSNFKAKYKNQELAKKNEEYARYNRLILLVSIIVLTLMILALAAMFFAFKQKAKAHHIAQDVEKMRTNFFTNITHEFRTPLTVILGISKKLQHGNLAPDEDPKTLLGMINRQGTNLLGLINQLLDISKVKSEIGVPDWRNGNIVVYAYMIIETYQEYGKEKQVNIIFAPEEKSIMMDFVPEYLRKVLANLISNALKFTPEKGNIYITICQKDDNLRLRVADTGCGIPPEEMPHIFDAFYQGENCAQHVGTGVGLALVKQIITTLNGKIEVASEPGKGTVFTIHVPLKHANAKEVKPLDLKEVDTSALLDAELSEDYNTLVLPRGQEPHANDDSRHAPVVLIVEDEADVSYYIGSQLKKDYTLYYAHNGVEGLEVAQEVMPDLVITDLMMPGGDGYQLCQRMHESEALNHIPIIILTAKVQEGDRIRGVEVGADAYTTKPFSAQELDLQVKRLIELRQLLRLKFSQAIIEDREDEVPLGKMDRDFLNKFVDVVNSKMEKCDINVDALASTLCMSTKQLRSKIMALTGENPNCYITQIRMNKARRLLKSTNLSIGEVAMSCGFEDNAYFSRAFKQMFKMTPTQFRNMNA